MAVDVARAETVRLERNSKGSKGRLKKAQESRGVGNIRGNYGRRGEDRTEPTK